MLFGAVAGKYLPVPQHGKVRGEAYDMIDKNIAFNWKRIRNQKYESGYMLAERTGVSKAC